MSENHILTSVQVLDQVGSKMHEIGDEVRSLFPEKKDKTDAQLFQFEIATMIRFFAGDGNQWHELSPDIRRALLELANPSLFEELNLDIRALMDEQETQIVIQILQAMLVQEDTK